MNNKEIECFQKYSSRLNRSGLNGLLFSDLIDLFPEDEKGKEVNAVSATNMSWPFGDLTGVYLVYNIDMNLIYVGCATKLATRLGHHFGGGTQCVLNGKWGKLPRYLKVVGIPEKTWFEAYGLERFLIWELQPELNTIGMY